MCMQWPGARYPKAVKLLMRGVKPIVVHWVGPNMVHTVTTHPIYLALKVSFALPGINAEFAHHLLQILAHLGAASGNGHAS